MEHSFPCNFFEPFLSNGKGVLVLLLLGDCLELSIFGRGAGAVLASSLSLISRDVL